jgi:SWI/SNF-related matrix-associated actin-dependent regulator of chromatin subfamily A-like protein 1
LIEACAKVYKLQKKLTAIEKKTMTNIPCPTGLSYLPYQLEGIRFALARTSTLIADEMGLGKTVQAIGIINALKPRTVLIVCPASLKLNWRNELSRWLTFETTVHVMGVPPHGEMRHSYGLITVCNYERLSKLDPKEEFELLIVDEAHYAKNDSAKRTKAVRSVSRRSLKEVFLSGTPLLSRPIELFPLLSMLAPNDFDTGGFAHGERVGPGQGAGMLAFARRYCGAYRDKFGAWNYDGATNLDELQARLRATVMIRRMKAEVLTELPPKRRSLVVIGEAPLDDFPEIQDDETTIEEQIRKLHSVKVAFEKISLVRHETALRKVPYIIDHVRNALESGSEKIIVFAHHKDVIEEIFRGLFEYGCVVHTGDESPEARQNAVDIFQQDTNCRVFLGSLATAKEGITLTASSHEVFAEWPWTPSEVAQAEDRAHRIGQRNSVLSEFLAFDRSLDAKIAKMLVRKAAVIARAIDIPKQGELFK